MAMSFITDLFEAYVRILKRRPVTYAIIAIVLSVLYMLVLERAGFIHLSFFSQPAITVQFEATEIYTLKSDKLALKRVRLSVTSKEPFVKVRATIETPKSVDQIKLVSTLTKADISTFESPGGRKRFEVVYGSVHPPQELVMVLSGLPLLEGTSFDMQFEDTAVVVEVVGSTRSGRLFGASAIGRFSLQDSEQDQSSKDVPEK